MYSMINVVDNNMKTILTAQDILSNSAFNL